MSRPTGTPTANISASAPIMDGLTAGNPNGTPVLVLDVDGDYLNIGSTVIGLPTPAAEGFANLGSLL